MPASLGYYPPGLTWLPPSLLPFPSFVPLLPPFFAFPSSRPGSRLSPTPIHKRDVWTRTTDPFNTCLCEVLAWLLLPGRHVQGKWCLGLRIPLLGSSRVRRVILHTGASWTDARGPPFFCHPSSLIAVVLPPFHLSRLLLLTPSTTLFLILLLPH